MADFLKELLNPETKVSLDDAKEILLAGEKPITVTDGRFVFEEPAGRQVTIVPQMEPTTFKLTFSHNIEFSDERVFIGPLEVSLSNVSMDFIIERAVMYVDENLLQGELL